MGSGSSKPKPETTQSAPPTAKNTPRAPQRNKQFQEVQLSQAGTSQSRQRSSRSPGANTGAHQSTSQSRTPRDKEVGASGQTSTRQTSQRGKLTKKEPITLNNVKNESIVEKNVSASKKNERITKKQEPSDKKSENTKKLENASKKSDNDAKKEVTVEKKQGNATQKTPTISKESKSGVQKQEPAKKLGTNAQKALTDSKQQHDSIVKKGETDTQKQVSVPKKTETSAQKTQSVTKQSDNVVQKDKNVSWKPGLDTSKENTSANKLEPALQEKDSVTEKQNHVVQEQETIAKNQENTEGQQELVVEKQDEEKQIAEKILDDDPNDVLVNAVGNLDAADEAHKDETPVNGHPNDDQFLELGHDEIEGDEYYQGRDEENVNEDDFYDSEAETHHDDEHEDDDEDTVSVKEDDLVFETFYHRSGKEFQCIYQSGMRFYLDSWGSKEWQIFPKRWYNEGLLVTNTILKDDGNEVRNDQAGASGSGQGHSRSSRQQGQATGNSTDDREGFLMHPSRGRIPTYIFYKKHNVHMYFDKETGTWVRQPIGWELHHPMVKALVDQVEEAIPHWGDRHDILALLRACNYDPDECISIYLHLEGDEWLKVARTSKEAKSQENRENKMAELEKKVRDLEIALQKERAAKEEALKENEALTLKLSELEVENKQTEAQLSAATGGRPKTARPVSRMMVAGKVGKGGKGGKQVQAGEVVNPGDILDLNATAKEIRKSHTRLKLDVEKYMGELKTVMTKIAPAFKQLKQSEKGTMEEIEEVRALYRKEALQRRLLYNQLQELRGNIRVFCRARKDDRATNCLKFPTDQDIICIHPQQGKKMFSFDKVFEPNSTQEEIFEETKNIITSCADGYNVCLLAYGQTGSGKTFTMMGPEKNPGINVRAMKELFQVCGDRTETMKYEMTVALVEIYNEHIQDLLTSDAKTLELRTAGNKVDIPGLTYLPIKGLNDVKKVMDLGDQNRTTASTKMNSTSSRSHLVLMLSVVGQDKVTNAITKGTLTLCDLAGSERIAKTEAEGQRLIEAAAINKSLSALGQVFTALRTSQLHTPFRNSKLTQILQPSLSGDAKACLFVNVSPDPNNFLETVSTLTFGSNARQVALGQAKQNVSKGK